MEPTVAGERVTRQPGLRLGLAWDIGARELYPCMTTDAPMTPKNSCGGIRMLRLPRMATVLWAMSEFSEPRAAPSRQRQGGVEGIASHNEPFFR